MFCSLAVHAVCHNTHATSVVLLLRGPGPGPLLRLWKWKTEIGLWIQADTEQPLFGHEWRLVADLGQLQGGQWLSICLAGVSIVVISDWSICVTTMALNVPFANSMQHRAKRFLSTVIRLESRHLPRLPRAASLLHFLRIVRLLSHERADRQKLSHFWGCRRRFC